MKKIIYLFVIFIAMVSFQACSGFLDIRPENELVLEDYWQTEAQATAVLSSCYRALTLDDNVNRMIVWGEVRSDEVVAGKVANEDLDLVRMLNVAITPTNGWSNWGSFYSVINYCNTFLHYAPGVIEKDPKFTLTKLHSMEAEARSIRALCYFYLVRTFRDVPLVLEPSISDGQNYFVGKSSERQVVDQIIADLQYAKQYIRADYNRGSYNKGRFTMNAVNALLADVYLWDQQYQKCSDACSEILADKTLKLVSAENYLADVFYTGNSTESIFELQFDKDIQNNNAVNNFYGSSGTEGKLSFPEFLTTKGTYSPFNYKEVPVPESVNDVRGFSFFGNVTNGTGYMIFKYTLSQITQNADMSYNGRLRLSTEPVNWIIYRLTDVMLMKAEALTELDTKDGKAQIMNLVNTSYLRSNPSTDSLSINSYPDKQSLEKLVLRERQRELMFEGKRWFDLMRVARRQNQPAAILSYVGPKLSGSSMGKNKMSVMDALYMPILKSEIDINPEVLIQNPFYTDENLEK